MLTDAQLNEKLKQIAIEVKNHFATRPDEIKKIDINLLSGHIATLLSVSFGVSDDDNGPFDSSFCYNLEQHILKTLEQYHNEGN